MVALFASIFSIAKKIPWQVWGLTGGLLIFYVWGEVQYYNGKKEVQEQWERDKQQKQVVISKLQEDAKKVTTIVIPKYIDRIVTIHEKGDEIIKKVPIYIPADSCPLPGGFRLLHDAAAANARPSERADAAPVEVRTAASTISKNYQTYHETAARLVSLQDWVVEVCKLYNRDLPKNLRSQCVLPYEAHKQDMQARL